jgi:hypothetical protein
MTIDQEKMIGELIDKIDSTDYDSLEYLAQLAYNKAIENVLELELLMPDEVEKLKI